MATNVIGFRFDATKPEPRSVNKSDAARIIGVSRKTVYRYITNGLLETTANGRVTARSINLLLKETAI